MATGEVDELLDVRQAARLADRHPETVRRWVWSGRLPARREGNRLLVARGDVVEIAGASGRPAGLAAWAERAQAALEESASAGRRGSAKDLVIEDRQQRAEAGGRRTRR